MADNPKSFLENIKSIFSNPNAVKGAILTPYEETNETAITKKPIDKNKNAIKKLFGF